MSEYAARLIAENRQSRSPQLDLSYYKLDVLPPEISQLVWLESLKLYDSMLHDAALADLSPLAPLRKLRYLQAGRNQVSDLTPLQGMTALQTLWLNRTRVADLTPLRHLSTLTMLSLANTEVSDLSPLVSLPNLSQLYIGNTPVSDIGPLAGLRQLTMLGLSGSRVTDLAPLCGFPVLAYLALGNCRIADPGPVCSLPALLRLELSESQFRDYQFLGQCLPLQALHLARSAITELGALATLRQLRELDLYKTGISDLTPLVQLPNLRKLNLSETRVTSLLPLRHLIANGCTVGRDTSMQGSPDINIEHAPISLPPPDIIHLGCDTMSSYFEQMLHTPHEHLREVDILLLGAQGAGKSTLRLHLFPQAVPAGVPTAPKQSGTPGCGDENTVHGSIEAIRFYRDELALENGERLQLNIRDFSGHPDALAVIPQWLASGAMVVFVHDGRLDSEAPHDRGFDRWFPMIKTFCGDDCEIFLFGNEFDGKYQPLNPVSFQVQFKMVKGFFHGNLQTPGAASSLQQELLQRAPQMARLRYPLPASWLAVRQALAERAQLEHMISEADYFAIYARHLPMDPAAARHLSRYLHQTGMLLHFQQTPQLAHWLILDPAWAMSAVSRVLHYPLIRQQGGIFSASEVANLWPEPSYRQRLAQLLALLLALELAFPLPDGERWCLAQALPDMSDMPDLFKQLRQYREQERDILPCTLAITFGPGNALSRLIVRLHRFLHPALPVLRFDAMFCLHGAEVRLDCSRFASEIGIKIWGGDPAQVDAFMHAQLRELNHGHAAWPVFMR